MSDDVWQDISSAPRLARVFVAGWNYPVGLRTNGGWWWVYEDMTDEKGVPIDHPNALLWQPLPAAPTRPGPTR